MSSANREAKRDAEAIARLSELARSVAEAPADTERDRAGRARLLMNVRRELDPPSRRALLPFAFAAALVAVVAAGGYSVWPRPLAYEVRGARLVGPYVSASSAPVRVVEDADGWTLRTHNRMLAVHHEHTIVIRRGTPLVLTAAA